MFFFIFQALTILSLAWGSPEKTFSYHLITEPSSLDSALTRGVSGAYLFNNIYSSLFTYDNDKGLVPEGAKFCKWSGQLKLVCQLNPEAKFSNGLEVKAEHYVNSFRHIFNIKSFHTELLLQLKNAKQILSDQLPTTSLGVTAVKNQLIFLFEKPDADFLYKLSRSAFTPRFELSPPSFKNASKLIHYGPYSIKQVNSGKSIDLEPSPHYHWPKNSKPPRVKIYFVDSHETALRLYTAKRLNFLRYLSSQLISKYKDQPGFMEVPMARFDYIGFSGTLTKNSQLRKHLSESLQYKELQKIYSSKGTPGCPSLPKKYYGAVECFSFKAHEKQQWNKKSYKIEYSNSFGSDISRGMEWVQHQWKENLNLNFELNPMEQNYFLNRIQQYKSDVFRKGVNLDRPTCLAALESFHSNSPENYIQFKSNDYDSLLQQLNNPTTKNKTSLCKKALELLLKSHLLIPLGETYFAMLNDGHFVGWSVNELNQLNLRGLRQKL